MNHKDIINAAILKIDQRNQEDPNIVTYKNQSWRKEHLNSVWMTEQLFQYIEEPSSALQIACRAHHICRWEIPRADFPEGKAGYYRWRTSLYKHHSNITRGILSECHVDIALKNEICSIIEKKDLKTNLDTQLLEDVICHVFLLYYAEPFSTKHPESKVIDILEKSWTKLSITGKAQVKKLSLNKEVVKLISKSNIA